ncbi:Potassium channel GORK [Apostasia shenzhenica]|uniref:Potassium channel GORK n=1 Tax=Apostasia shenzhenica TaxID=1088818 RepID=A0A2I0AR24_9ASPA|nr:Potassium channel GORK [Apostasia shenzhenica]
MGRRTVPRPFRAETELALPSHRLLEAALRGNTVVVEEILTAAAAGTAEADVNYIGTATLRVKCTEVVLREERADDVRIGYEEFRTDVSALFAAAHSGHADVVRKMLSAGADVNQEFFRGYAITAAAREGHCDIVSMLLKTGASQSACEDALLEASLCCEVEAVKLLICSEMASPDNAAHALVAACSRGFLDVVVALVEVYLFFHSYTSITADFIFSTIIFAIFFQNGVDINCLDRVLLQSVKPALHANVDCTPLVAAIVSKQSSSGASTACLVKVGAWSWDPISGEELRVGACLGEPYNAAWCAVEFYEASGEILKSLLDHCPALLEDLHLGRTPLCHAILCQNSRAVKVLLDFGANSKFTVKTKQGFQFCPIHLVTQLGSIDILRHLVSHGCDVSTRTSTGETPLMISAKSNQEGCFLELILAGADLGLVSCAGDNAIELAKKSTFSSSIMDIISKALSAGAIIYSSDLKVFSPLHFIVGCGCAETLQMMLNCSTSDLNKLDRSGSTPIMVAAMGGHLEAFRLLVMAGADISVRTPDGSTIMSILHYNNMAGLKDSLEKILLDGVLANIIAQTTPFRPLHYAARKGDTSSSIQLLKMQFPVDSLDENGYSPLMLAAIEGRSDVCKLLLVHGNADTGLVNYRNETALSLARCSSRSNKATEGLLLDHIARSHVIKGEDLCKHTREGRGIPHMKFVRMLKNGILTWGRASRRNVSCKEASAGPSLNFVKNRRKDGWESKSEIFRVVTTRGREVHFEASCVDGMGLWVHGINLVVKEAASSGA